MTSDARLLATLQRRLFASAGGVHEAATVAGVSDKLLYRAQDPNAEDDLCLKRLLVLARHAGDPSIFLALAEAVKPGSAETANLKDAALGSAVRHGELLRVVHDATADGQVTPREREDARRAVHEVKDALREVESALDQEAG